MKKPNRLYFMAVLTFLVLLLGYFSYEILRPFLYPIAWAVVLSILFYPVYTFIVRHTRMKSASSLVTLVLILITIIGPAFYLATLLVREVAALSFLFETGRIDALTRILEHPMPRKILAQIGHLIDMSEEELIRAVMNYLAGLGRGLLGSAAKGIGSVILAVLGFIVMSITLFFLLRDAPLVLRKVRDYLPFSEEQKDHLMKRSSDIIFSTIYGGVVVALAQGTVGGLAFALLGIATPVLWGVVIAVVSFLPVIGPGVVWIPFAVYMFVNGAFLKGALIIVAGTGIAAIDTFLRPLIIGNRVHLPFLIIFFSVVGGIQFFGFIGFILGPLVVALFIAVLDVLGSINEPPAPSRFLS